MNISPGATKLGNLDAERCVDLLSDLCDGVRRAFRILLYVCAAEEISHLYNKVVISHLGNLSCCWRDAKINRHAATLAK